MELRFILYGYKMSNQHYISVPREAEIVREIFKRYLSGETLKNIAEDFTRRQIPYYKDKTKWSKNMICRILENIKYTGDDEYERTIEDDIFEKAVQLKNSKGGTRETDSNEVKFLKYHTVCAECGGRFTRRSKYKTREKWMCSCGCKTDVYIDDKFYYSRICGIFNRVILNSELLKCPTTLNEYTPNLDVVRKDKEISRILDQAEVQFSPVKQMIFDLTSAKFDCCHLDNSGAYTDLLMDYLRERPLMEQIELDLLKQTVSDITVKKDGEIAIRFVNEKEISSETEEDLNDGNNASITENRN